MCTDEQHNEVLCSVLQQKSKRVSFADAFRQAALTAWKFWRKSRESTHVLPIMSFEAERAIGLLHGAFDPRK